MNIFDLGFALAGFLAFVAVVPAWMYFATQHPALSSVPLEVKFLAGLALPATATLFLASWAEPGG